MSIATPTITVHPASAVPAAPRAERFAKAARKALTKPTLSTDAADNSLAQKTHKRLTASIHGMSVGTERRFLHAIRQFGYGIKPDTRILKDGSAGTSADSPDAVDSTAGEFALKYLIGQSLKRRKKMLLRKGKSVSEIETLIAESAPDSADAPVTSKLDLRPLAIQKRESKQASKSEKKGKASTDDAAATDGAEGAVVAKKTRAAPKRKTPTADEVNDTKPETGDATAAAPKKKRARLAAPTDTNANVAPASVTPAREGK